MVKYFLMFAILSPLAAHAAEQKTIMPDGAVSIEDYEQFDDEPFPRVDPYQLEVESEIKKYKEDNPCTFSDGLECYTQIDKTAKKLFAPRGSSYYGERYYSNMSVVEALNKMSELKQLAMSSRWGSFVELGRKPGEVSKEDFEYEYKWIGKNILDKSGKCKKKSDRYGYKYSCSIK